MGKRQPTLVSSRSWEERLEIGEVSVDSGTLAIIDPGYLHLPSFWQGAIRSINEKRLPAFERGNLQCFRADPGAKTAAERDAWFDYTTQFKIGGQRKAIEPALAAIRDAARALRDKGVIFGTGGDATWKLVLVSKFTEEKWRIGAKGRIRTITQARPLRIEFEEVE